MSKWEIRPVRDNLDSIMADARRKAVLALGKAGFEGLSQMKQDEPVDTGFLRNSTNGELIGLRFVYTIGADYWIYPNDGTRFIPGKFFVESGFNRAVTVLNDALDAIARRVK